MIFNVLATLVQFWAACTEPGNVVIQGSSGFWEAYAPEVQELYQVPEAIEDFCAQYPDAHETGLFMRVNSMGHERLFDCQGGTYGDPG